MVEVRKKNQNKVQSLILMQNQERGCKKIAGPATTREEEGP